MKRLSCSVRTAILCHPNHLITSVMKDAANESEGTVLRNKGYSVDLDNAGSVDPGEICQQQRKQCHRTCCTPLQSGWDVRRLHIYGSEFRSDVDDRTSSSGLIIIASSLDGLGLETCAFRVHSLGLNCNVELQQPALARISSSPRQ